MPTTDWMRVKPHKDSGKAGLINRIFFFAMGTFLSNWPYIFSRFLDQYEGLMIPIDTRVLLTYAGLCTLREWALSSHKRAFEPVQPFLLRCSGVAVRLFCPVPVPLPSLPPVA